MSESIIGIDLGTTNSCVAFMKDGKTKAVEVIVNAEGEKTTASVVAFRKGEDGKEEELVGSVARRQAVTNAAKTVHGSKRLIGRRFDDLEVQKLIKTVPYKIVKAKNGDAWVDIDGELKAPSQIGATILRRLKESAEAFLGKTVHKAVITVPAYFNDAQRQATKDAGQIAGLEVMRIINEPTAAALAYGLDKKGSRKIAIVDLGGGTFDVSVLEIDNDVFEVNSTNGDTFLGGEDFDHAIQEYLVAEFKKSDGVDLTKDIMALQRLKESAERAKIELTNKTATDINLPYITADASGPKHLNIKLSRSKLEQLTESLLNRLVEPCKKALKDAKLETKDINDVVLVGGMTRMPKVISIIKEFFGKEPHRGVNPDEVVAIGAAVQAGVLSGDVDDIVLLDVCPLSLGLETMGGVMTKLVERNTTIPIQKKQVFSTADDNQSAVTIRIAQGERPMVSDNKILGDFTLDGIPPARKGVPQIEVCFDIDANGILSVSAKDKGTGKEQQITIKTSGGLSDEEISKMVQDAEKNANTDKDRKDLADARNSCDNVVYSAESLMSEQKDKLTDEQKKDIEESLSKAKSAKDKDDVNEIKSTSDNLQSILMQIGQSMYGDASKKDESNSSSSGDENVVDGESKE